MTNKITPEQAAEIAKKQGLLVIGHKTNSDHLGGVTNSDLAAIINTALEPYVKDGWISIEDRLPEIGDEVLFISTSNQKHVGIHKRPYGFKVMGSAVLYQAILWMPIPPIDTAIAKENDK